MTPEHGFDPETGELMSSERLAEYVRSRTDTLILSVSGKDSVACWEFLRDYDFRIIPYFCYSIPGLSYDVEWIKYLEDRYQTHIYYLPHPVFYHSLAAGVYNPPHLVSLLWRMHLAKFEFEDIERLIAQEHHLPDDYLAAVGIRAADNMERWRLIHQTGTLGRKSRHYYYAVWDWNIERLRRFLRERGLKLSKSYLYFGSTGDGYDYLFIKKLEEHGLHEDLEKVRRFFPLLADLEKYRYEEIPKWLSQR